MTTPGADFGAIITAISSLHGPDEVCELRAIKRANGTRILRSGEPIDVPRRDPVGVSLRSGDEVQLGKAAIRIRIDESAD